MHLRQTASHLIVIWTSHFSNSINHTSQLVSHFKCQKVDSMSRMQLPSISSEKTMQNFLAPNDTRKCLISLDNDALFRVPSLGPAYEHLRPGRKCFHSKISNFDPLTHVTDIWLTHFSNRRRFLHFQMRCLADAHVTTKIFPKLFSNSRLRYAGTL